MARALQCGWVSSAERRVGLTGQPARAGTITRGLGSDRVRPGSLRRLSPPSGRRTVPAAPAAVASPSTGLSSPPCTPPLFPVRREEFDLLSPAFIFFLFSRKAQPVPGALVVPRGEEPQPPSPPPHLPGLVTSRRGTKPSQLYFASSHTHARNIKTQTGQGALRRHVGVSGVPALGADTRTPSPASHPCRAGAGARPACVSAAASHTLRRARRCPRCCRVGGRGVGDRHRLGEPLRKRATAVRSS